MNKAGGAVGSGGWGGHDPPNRDQKDPKVRERGQNFLVFLNYLDVVSVFIDLKFVG